jgi:hypothetical protein
MKQSGYIIGVLLLAMAATAVAAGGDESGLAATLRQVVENNLAAYNREDRAATMRSIHTKAPDYADMQQALLSQFSALDARTELVSFRYIGHDDEFAIARVKLKTVDQSGEPFVANILDTITLFHQQDGAWKYWDSYVLGVELLP